MTCAANYAADMPRPLKAMVKKTQKGDKAAWKSLPEEIIETGLRGATTGPGQGCVIPILLKNSIWHPIWRMLMIVDRNAMRAMMTTTQATDIIHGGLKVNALVRTVAAH